jgi:uncharacterized membrane protein YebE (DUF533 family)
MRFSEEAMLELGTDGRIDPAAREQARLADAAMRPSVARETAALMEGAARKPRRDVVGEMARAIAAAVTARQTVQVQDFARIGVDPPTAERLFPDALARARKLDPAVGLAMEAAA